MIQTLTINNFQSHKETVLNFHPGINVIVGSSDSGKTAALRALCWVVENRPLGDGFVSEWAYDQKGKHKLPTCVEVQFDDTKITRLRDAEYNCYIIDGKKLEAFGMNVPEEVTKFVNLSDINIAKQRDKPFLMGETPGEIARTLNKIINLELIDKVLKTAEQKKRSNNKQLKTITAEIDDYNKQLASFQWLPKAQELLKQWEQSDKEKKKLQEQKNQVQQLIAKMKEVESLSFIPQAQKLVAKIDTINKEYTSKKRRAEQLQQQIKQFSGSITASQYDTTSVNSDYQELQELLVTKKELVDFQKQLTDSIKQYYIASKNSTINVQLLIDFKNRIEKMIGKRKEAKERAEQLKQLISQYQKVGSIEQEIQAIPVSICPTCGTIIGGTL